MLSEKLKQAISYGITIAIILCLSAFLFFLYFVNIDNIIKLIGSIAAFLIALTWIRYEFRHKRKTIVYKEYESPVKRFILMSRDGEREKEWYVEGRNSFLIGKGTATNEVDIELGDIHFSEFISNKHAVLNYADGFWYIEDLNSFNGVGVKKKGEEYALRLKPLVSYKIDEGDIIYIAKAKILVR